MPAAPAVTLGPGPVGELRAIRAHWRKLAPAAAALDALGFAAQAAPVAEICNILGQARFAVPVPCMFCSTPVPCEVRIGDPGNPEPGAVICGRCSARIDARVAESRPRCPDEKAGPADGS